MPHPKASSIRCVGGGVVQVAYVWAKRAGQRARSRCGEGQGAGGNRYSGSAGRWGRKLGQNFARTPNTKLRPASGAMSFSTDVDTRISSFSRFFASTK